MATLDDLATAALKNHKGNVEKALPEFIRAVHAAKLIDDLARDFLHQVAGRGSGQSGAEAQVRHARPTPSAPAAGSIKVRPTKVPVPHRRRTQEEKDAATQAMLASAEAVFEIQIEGRALGKYRIGELAALKRDCIDAATHMLMLGTEQARNAVLAELIVEHCTVQDQLISVREACNASTLARLVERAEQEAPRRVADGMARAAEVMAHKHQEITQ